MLCEFTTLKNLPCFIEPSEVASIEQKARSTHVYLKSGVKLIIKECAAEAKADVENKLNESLMEQLLGNSSNIL